MSAVTPDISLCGSQLPDEMDTSQLHLEDQHCLTPEGTPTPAWDESKAQSSCPAREEALSHGHPPRNILNSVNCKKTRTHLSQMNIPADEAILPI